MTAIHKIASAASKGRHADSQLHLRGLSKVVESLYVPANIAQVTLSLPSFLLHARYLIINAWLSILTSVL